MKRYNRRIWGLAACYSALAGFVDALGFLYLGGFFVSFMSGNSTRLAVGLSTNLADASVASALIASFVTGVMLGSLFGRRFTALRHATIMALIAALLTLAAILATGHENLPAAVVLAIAMGVENALFEHDGEIQIGLTYMTGTLVKFGQRVVSALIGDDRYGWVPYLLLWLGLLAGATAGAACFEKIGYYGFWIAASMAALLSVFSALAAANLSTTASHERGER